MKLLCLLLALTTVNCNPFTTLFAWKQLDHTFLDANTRKLYVKARNNFQENAVPYGLNVWDDRLFLTVTRCSNGFPANLNFINITEAQESNQLSPLLNSYPEQELNYIVFDDSIVNIRRFAVDACNRLWGIDGGDIIGNSKFPKPKRLLAIDLVTNKVVLSHTFSDDIQQNSFFVNTIVDVEPQNCSDAYVYNADRDNHGIVVYSMAKNSSWRISHNYFHGDPFNGDFNVNGRIYQSNEGVVGMVLSAPKLDGSKTLYFHSLSGIHEFSVSTNILKNLTQLHYPRYLRQFRVSGTRGHNTQATISVLDDSTGIIYFTQVNKNAIACWDTQNALTPQTFTIVAQDEERLIYPNDIVIEPKTRKLYVLSNNLPVLHYGKYDPTKKNFYILVASLDELAATCRGESANWFMKKIKGGAAKVKSMFGIV